jgi:V8-like Glu-specific endopeptidase
MLKSLKKLINLLILGCLIFGSPIIMDHARDIYMNEVVRRKANPVSYRGKVFGSSFQLEYKGTTLTVTNHHVCDVIQDIKRQALLDSLDAHLTLLFLKGVPPASINDIYVREKNRIMSMKFKVVGEYLNVGEFQRKILFMSRSHDICFLQPTGGMSFNLAMRVDNGERVSIVGHPRGRSQSVSDGRITGSKYFSPPWLKTGMVRSLTTTALSYPGNSGSPVVNRYGNVVGILFAVTSVDYINVNSAVPLEYIRADFEQYLQESK